MIRKDGCKFTLGATTRFDILYFFAEHYLKKVKEF